MMKGAIQIFPIILVLMLFTSTIGAMVLFGSEMIYKRRERQEILLSLGNEVELYYHLLENAGGLSVVQAVKDIGNNEIINQIAANDYYYSSDNYLPFWESIPKKEIKNQIESLSEMYFSEYVKSYQKYFIEKTRQDKILGGKWSIEWQANVRLSENPKEIKTNFGKVTIRYDSPTVNIIREIEIEPKLKTNFFETLDISEKIINDLNKDAEREYVCCTLVVLNEWKLKNDCKFSLSTESSCNPSKCQDFCSKNNAISGAWDASAKTCFCKYPAKSAEATSEDILNKIEDKYKTIDIDVDLTKLDKSITVKVLDKKSYGLYDFTIGDIKEKHLGTMFNVDLGGSSKIKYTTFSNLVKCGFDWAVRSSERGLKASEVCTVVLSTETPKNANTGGYCIDGTYCLYGCAINGYDCNPDPRTYTICDSGLTCRGASSASQCSSDEDFCRQWEGGPTACCETI